jgi:hypothetical protein
MQAVMVITEAATTTTAAAAAVQPQQVEAEIAAKAAPGEAAPLVQSQEPVWRMPAVEVALALGPLVLVAPVEVALEECSPMSHMEPVERLTLAAAEVAAVATAAPAL